jgi:hypothetical protein
VGNEKFSLTPKQVAILREASTAGNRGLVFFDDFAISIPHISHIKIKRREYFRIEGNVRKMIGKSEYEESVKELSNP